MGGWVNECALLDGLDQGQKCELDWWRLVSDSVQIAGCV